jgi:hypothetical protein
VWGAYSAASVLFYMDWLGEPAKSKFSVKWGGIFVAFLSPIQSCDTSKKPRRFKAAYDFFSF